jgi:hypothetical protein
MTQGIKLCKDCKHYRKTLTAGLCDVVKVGEFDYATGKTNWTCLPKEIYKQRGVYGRCGERALLFEPKPPFLQEFLDYFRSKS